MTTKQILVCAERSMRLALLLIVWSVVCGCGGSTSADGLSASRGGPGDRPRVEISPTDPDSASRLARPIHVVGVVAPEPEGEETGASGVLEERRITIVDARGRRFDRVTDERGGFAVDDVVPPYDLAAHGLSSSTAKSGATVLLGVKRADPYIELAQARGRQAKAGAAPHQLIRASLPPNICPNGGGSILVRTTSRFGEGAATVPCEGTSSSTNAMDVEVMHLVRRAWDGSDGVGGTTEHGMIDVHVLVMNDARTSFAYARKRDAAAVQPGRSTDVGLLEPVAVASSAPLVLGADEGDLHAWSWATEVVVEADGFSKGADVAHGGWPNGFVFATSMRPNEAMSVPLLPGLVVRVAVSATHPRFDGRGGRTATHQSLRVWSGPLWPGQIGHLIEMPSAPEMVRPMPGSIFSRHGEGFAWRIHEKVPSLSRLIVTEIGRDENDDEEAVRCTIMTDATEVTLARLSTLGLSDSSSLSIGNHTLDLTTTPSASVDHISSPDAHLRHAESEEQHQGASTHLRFGFQVVR